jgi:SAM-dependent methyltransferase
MVAPQTVPTFPGSRPRSHFSYVPRSTQDFLDVGCNDGGTLEYALAQGIPRVYGIDINAAAIQLARQKLGKDPRAVIHEGSADALPFADESMDVVHCAEVLEHVPEELRPTVVREIRRVMRPGGRLIMSVPHDGLFAFLDPSNMRFRAPAAWRLASRLAGGRSRDVGYEGAKHGVVWHHHFRVSELQALLAGRFALEQVNCRGTCLMPLTEALAFPLYRRRMYGHPLFGALKRIAGWDESIDAGERFGYNVLVVARAC